MNIILISQCHGSALVETRRVLDQFAERRGDRTWQTPITMAGLDTIRKLLKKRARKNTAVACHWVRGKGNTELIWVVGNTKKFSAQGAVPTDTTEKNVLKNEDEDDWLSGRQIRSLAAISGLFHDYGKANAQFQAKIKNSSNKAVRDPVRHEWVSLCLFVAQIKDCKSDQEWLEQLRDLKSAEDAKALTKNVLSSLNSEESFEPFDKIKHLPVASAVGWLILSHHRLPTNQSKDNAPSVNSYENFPLPFRMAWNDAVLDPDKKSLTKNWKFDGGLPHESEAWRRRAQLLAERALSAFSREQSILPIADPYMLHTARLCLMIGDHHYSGEDFKYDSSDTLQEHPKQRFGSDGFQLYANTDRKTGDLKQQLDDHLIGVARHASQVFGALTRFEQELPRLARHRAFTRRTADPRFSWQNKAYDVSVAVREASHEGGFFGVNMASTGCGKTITNGRIIYGLAHPDRGARFTVALGLRALTLQTGDAYRERLHLSDDELAVLVGGSATRQLYELIKDSPEPQIGERSGSESLDEWLDSSSHVHFEGNSADGPLHSWLKKARGANALLQAPILACTIDHLMPATEATRGAHHIPPMLRLLGADLILDEPDDFDRNDLPALARLVHMAGLLGSRVLLSSATLPPSMIQVLFHAYQQGRSHFRRHRRSGRDEGVVCAWFDEFGASSLRTNDVETMMIQHKQFCSTRVERLREQSQRRKMSVVEFPECENRSAIWESFAQRLPQWLSDLHKDNSKKIPGSNKTVSFGLIRCAYIKDIVGLTRYLQQLNLPDFALNLRVYHSGFPLLVRSNLEKNLDRIFNRKDPEAILKEPSVRSALNQNNKTHHVFIILASPVAELGRDHEYDWAIVEPSSMRSIIQLAGRVRRHRTEKFDATNILVLERNFKAANASNKGPWYQKPGFETKNLRLNSRTLKDSLLENQYQPLDAAPRVLQRHPAEPNNNLVDLEHRSLGEILGTEPARKGRATAAHWWTSAVWLSGQLQKAYRFREGEPQLNFCLIPDEESSNWTFEQDGVDQNHLLDFTNQISDGPGYQSWLVEDPWNLVEQLADKKECSLESIARAYMLIQLAESQSAEGWIFENDRGFYPRKDSADFHEE